MWQMIQKNGVWFCDTEVVQKWIVLGTQRKVPWVMTTEALKADTGQFRIILSKVIRHWWHVNTVPLKSG